MTGVWEDEPGERPRVQWQVLGPSSPEILGENFCSGTGWVRQEVG